MVLWLVFSIEKGSCTKYLCKNRHTQQMELELYNMALMNPLALLVGM